MGAEYSQQGKNAVGRHLIYEAYGRRTKGRSNAVVENEQPGRIIHQTVRVMAMVGKHQRKSVMIVTVVAINK
ncbi:unnamed protein product [Adineta ricciae]|uniref:Uncharacterized protein n=1 Tax=Adineta ricciae TaxID=249248 RepID=A0A813NDV6_ADIRI|nr:unnamed protein product [Adineta ricciae]